VKDWEPEFPFTFVIPEAVTAEVPSGFVVLQVKLTMQLFAPEVIVQVEEPALSVPVITDLFSEQDAFVPPFEPLHIHVHAEVPSTLLPLVPVEQL
jgi:hypothetical protein